MGEGTVVVTLSDVLVALKALQEEVQMLRKLVQPVTDGPVLGRPEKDVEPRRPDAQPYWPYPPAYPHPPSTPYIPAPWQQPYATWTAQAGPSMIWNGARPT